MFKNNSTFDHYSKNRFAFPGIRFRVMVFTHCSGDTIMLHTGKIALLALLGLLAAGLLLLPVSPESVNRFGWVRDEAAANAFAASLPQADFRLTPAFRQSVDDDGDVYLWEAARFATGGHIPARNQGNVGACVGFGTAAAIEYLQCQRITDGESETFRALAPEIIYAGSRVEIGGGRIRGDGSVGAWAAKFVREYGTLPRDRYPHLDLSRYSEKLCRKLGQIGVPDPLEPRCREHPVRSVTRIGSFEECRAALRNGYPMIVCSDRGFDPRRDADGFCKPQGIWMHCMAIVGVRGGDRPGAFLLNSWGANAHAGPRGHGDPPEGGFWADADVVDAMLRQGDSWGFSHYEGFPAKSNR
jgi:hypothetical protein